MPGLVLDASVALAWLLPGEDGDGRADALMARVVEQGAVVPAIWRLEVGNAVVTAERRGRLPPGTARPLLSPLGAIPITVDPETDTHSWEATLTLALAHRLTLYDAAYLELAWRRSLPIATFDADLDRAARAIGLDAGPVNAGWGP